MGFEIEGTILKKYTEEPGVEKVVIPDGITEIAPMAMSFECDHIKEIVVPEGVTEIGYECFWYNKSLEKVKLPDSLTVVRDSLFSHCPKLQVIKLSPSLKVIGSSMFAGCTGLKEIIIPEGVETIGRAAFMGCKALKKVVLPASLKRIEPYAFHGCTKLQDIQIPDSLSVAIGAFEGCKSLDKKAEYVILRDELYGYNGDGNKVIIPDGVRTFGHSVFAKNKKIKEVYIPDSVEEIGREAFKGCSNLQKVRISPKIGKIKAEMFWDCKALEAVDVPEGITSIEENAFRHCYALKEITLPYSVSTIGKKAFAGTTETYWKNIHTVIIAPGTKADDIVSPEDQLSAAIGYVRKPELYKDRDVIQSYQSYLSKKKKTILPMIWEDDLGQAIDVLAESGILTNKTFEGFLQNAHENKAIGCVASLMDWKNKQ